MAKSPTPKHKYRPAGITEPNSLRSGSTTSLSFRIAPVLCAKHFVTHLREIVNICSAVFTLHEQEYHPTVWEQTFTEVGFKKGKHAVRLMCLTSINASWKVIEFMDICGGADVNFMLRIHRIRSVCFMKKNTSQAKLNSCPKTATQPTEICRFNPHKMISQLHLTDCGQEWSITIKLLRK